MNQKLRRLTCRPKGKILKFTFVPADSIFENTREGYKKSKVVCPKKKCSFEIL